MEPVNYSPPRAKPWLLREKEPQAQKTNKPRNSRLVVKCALPLFHSTRTKPWLLRERAEAGVKEKKATKGCFLCELALPRRWRRHPDLNRGIRALQAHALPLGYSAVTSLE